jgi:hypothetical protein
MIPSRVKKELRNSSIIEAFNHFLKKSIGLSICEISNKREIGEFLLCPINGVKFLITNNL